MFSAVTSNGSPLSSTNVHARIPAWRAASAIAPSMSAIALGDWRTADRTAEPTLTSVSSMSDTVSCSCG